VLKASSWQNADAPSFEELSACVRCGMCLEACPTYRELKVEMDSPRGRLQLMRGLVERKIEATPSVLEHLDRCLDCRACETACPSTVHYGEILEKTRTVLQPGRASSVIDRFWRWFALRVLLRSRVWQGLLFKLIWLSQRVGLVAIGQWLGEHRLLPRRAAEAIAQNVNVPFRSFRDRHEGALDRRRNALVFPAKGERRARVALLTGCVADHLFADVNEATVRVLTENGCDVEVPAQEGCCGALHIHNGARDDAKSLARSNVRLIPADDYDALVSNAAGCSAELRHYGALLGGDVAATAFSSKVRDICEFLCELGLRPPRSGATIGRVAYDEPCHLLHAQKISDPPKRILGAIPGVTMVPLEEADACCGGAGIYWLQQPDLSQKIASRKVEAIRRSGAEVVTIGNPGCLLQIRSALRAAGLDVKVVHPIELLARAYTDLDGRGFSRSNAENDEPSKDHPHGKAAKAPPIVAR
jgi:glycolate oxidase iron-sulfur subunit